MKLLLSPAPHVHAEQSTRTLMLNVLIALIPCVLAGLWFYGPCALLTMLVGMGSAVLAEYIWQRAMGKKVLIGDLSAAVTGLILALNLSARAPFWVVAIGSAFAIIIVKCLFGGLGGNFVNPALAARAFLLATMPAYMTIWCEPTGLSSALDAVSAATPLSSPSYSIMQLFMGNIPGAIGETCKLAILLGLAWLIYTNTISWRIPAVMIASTFVFSLLFGKNPFTAIFSGGMMFGAVFMATDYVTCPMTAWGQIVYAAAIGLLVVLLRNFSAYPEGTTYAILIMNIAAPLIDKCFVQRVYGHNKEANTENA